MTLSTPLSSGQSVLFDTPAELVEPILPEKRLAAKGDHREGNRASATPLRSHAR
jgi:hypothetical protein